MNEMHESLHAAKMREKYPCPEPDPAQEIRILRTLIVEEGKVGFLGCKNETIHRLKRRYPAAYEAFCQQYKRKVLERCAYSPYLEEKTKELSGSEDGEKQLRTLRGMRSTMIKFKLGYGGYVMGMLFAKAKSRYPEAYEAFKKELAQ
ncbi:MAG: hypothetical protein M3N10_00560 [Actinomycetota bacterium]|nr:hypothetical protein [Actinomycetota bacterium]